MAPRPDLPTLYRSSRLALADLVADLPAPKEVAVPACPGWTVHDVVAHLVGIAEDVEAGRLTGPPGDEETAVQVARWSEVPTGEVLAEWERRAHVVEDLLARETVWPAVLDVLSHEHDVRGAVHRPGRRDDIAVTIAARLLLRTLEVPVPLAVRCGELSTGPEPTPDTVPLALETTPFEVLRFRLGRRSRTQMAAMAWSTDPGPVLDHLAIFGPSPEPIVE